MKYIFLIAIFTITTSLNAQSIGTMDSLDVYKIQNEQFESLIDKAVSFEKKCPYYDNSLLFYVHFQEESNEKMMQVGSGIWLEDLPPNVLGVFKYKSHTFVITGKFVFKEFFIKTERYIDKKSLRDSNAHHKKAQELKIEDDQFTFWVYKYEKGQFKRVAHHTYCDE